jgi:hypothetical protein
LLGDVGPAPRPPDGHKVLASGPGPFKQDKYGLRA